MLVYFWFVIFVRNKKKTLQITMANQHTISGTVYIFYLNLSYSQEVQTNQGVHIKFKRNNSHY